MIYPFIINDYLCYLKIKETNKVEILNYLKHYSNEKIIERKNAYITEDICRQLLNNIENEFDEVIVYDIEQTKNCRYDSINICVSAIVKEYSTLYKILNYHCPLQLLLTYLKGDKLLDEACNEINSQLISIEKNENGQSKYIFDSHISLNEKIAIIREYMLGLDVDLINAVPIKEKKRRFFQFGSRKNHINHIDIEEAKQNTLIYNELMQLLNLEKENKLVKTK